jgi:hypothetical protein
VARHNKLRILCTTLMKNSNFIEAGTVGAASLVFVDTLQKQAQVEIKNVKTPPTATSTPVAAAPSAGLKIVAN